MQNVINTIVPIFAVIILGVFLRARDLLPAGMIGPLNRLVYYFAIPCMIFSAVVKASFQVDFNPLLLAGTLIPVVVIFGAALLAGKSAGIDRRHMGTFVQTSFHGNLGYIGLAVCYYFAGGESFARASILAGFLMLLQNFLAVLGLQAFSPAESAGRGAWFFVKKIVGNPVIVSALLGMGYALLKLPLPPIVDRSLAIVSGMALPLALLVIGASLSFRLIKSHLSLVLGAGLFKLIALPGLGLLFYRFLDLPVAHYVPGVILLATPTATICYVMAGEMHGSTDLATAAITMNTLLSYATFIFWLGIFI
ncbi:MAG: AEC family transporter [Deltaproteobacteria bacterium]|nr:AEC family transporter [Deltaproteobacteria bacterium]